MSSPIHPVYSDVPGNLTDAPPFHYKKSRFYHLLFQGSTDNLKSICSKIFGPALPEGYSLQPWQPLVLYTVSDFQSVEDPLYNSRMSYFTIFLSLQKKGAHGGQSVFAFVPYTFTNNIISMCSAREVYGLPQSLGWIEGSLGSKAAEPGRNVHFFTDAIAIEKYDPDAKAARQRLFELRQKEVYVVSSAVTTRQDYHTAMKEQLQEEGFDLHASGLLEALWEGKMAFMSLKQFRDLKKGEGTCYRRIQEYRYHYAQPEKAGLIKGIFELDFCHVDMYPIWEDLGLKEKGNRTKNLFWTEQDLIMEAGKNMHF